MNKLILKHPHLTYQYPDSIIQTNVKTLLFKNNIIITVNKAARNRAYHVHKKLFSSKLISQNVKLQLYNTLIRPTVTYASET